MGDHNAADFGKELRRRREAAGLSLTALAANIHYSKSHLSKVETGRARANRAFAEACDRALLSHAVPGELPSLSQLARVSTPTRQASDPAPQFCGLPGVTRHFTGREQERAALTAFLTGPDDETTACVLAGMAGTGKTTLALRAAWDAASYFPDGCLHIDLCGHAPRSGQIDPHEALGRLLRMLGVPGADIPPDIDGRKNLYHDRLRGRRVLLVLDDIRSASQAIPLIPAESRCRVLITSRYRLNALDEAVHLSVEALPQAEAVTLFQSVSAPRAAAGRDDEDDEAIARVVEHCGRLPLTVRIAAARFRSDPTMTIREFAARLEDEAARLDTLDDGERSVAVAFRLSYEVLSPTEQTLFSLLALHPGQDVAPRAAAALAGVSLAEAERLLNRLAAAHLVIRLPGGYTGFHDLVRAFAVEYALPLLPATQQLQAVRRLLEFALLQASTGDRLLTPQRYRPKLALGSSASTDPGFTDRETALAWWEGEWPNLAALCGLAAARAQYVECWQLAYLLRDYFFRAKLWDAWIDTHRTAAEAAWALGDNRALAVTLSNLGMAYVDSGDLAEARTQLEHALDLFLVISDEHGAAGVRSSLGWVDLYLGAPDTALQGLKQALETYRRIGSPRNAAIALRGMALAETALGRYEQALEYAETAYTEVYELQLDMDMAMGKNSVAWVHFRADHPTTAVAHYKQAAMLAERSGSRHEAARAFTGLGNVAARTGEWHGAEEMWSRANALHPLHPVIVGEASARLILEGNQSATPARIELGEADVAEHQQAG